MLGEALNRIDSQIEVDFVSGNKVGNFFFCQIVFYQFNAIVIDFRTCNNEYGGEKQFEVEVYIFFFQYMTFH